MDTPHWRARSSSRTRLLGFPRLPVARIVLDLISATLQKIFRLRKFSFWWHFGFERHRGGACVAATNESLRDRLDLLIKGMTGLRHDGQFDEPNLDGTAGDYISFDSLGMAAGRRALRPRRGCGRSSAAKPRCDAARELVRASCRARSAATERQHHRADAGALDAVARDARSALAAGAGRLGEPRRQRSAAHAGGRLPARCLRQDQRRRAVGRHAVHGGAVSRLLWRRRPAGANWSRRRSGSSWSMRTISPTARPASGSTAGPSTAGTISPGRAGRAAMPGSRPASSI